MSPGNSERKRYNRQLGIFCSDELNTIGPVDAPEAGHFDNRVGAISWRQSPIETVGGFGILQTGIAIISRRITRGIGGIVIWCGGGCFLSLWQHTYDHSMFAFDIGIVYTLYIFFGNRSIHF